MIDNKAWNNFIKRVLPNHYSQIEYKEIPKESDCDVYEINGSEGSITLCGNSINSLAAALGRYLRDDAEVNLSWCGSRIDLPVLLPQPTRKKHIIKQKYRSYFNYCTFQYSASWWDWSRWEKELDFMALCGINLPLSAVGIECTWYETLKELGFTETEALGFFSGPAFLAWQWMTNIEGFCGPVTKEFLNKRLDLGQKIINRQIELGMTPIQQGFSGVVPRLLKEKRPDLKIQMKSEWCGIEGTAQLDPTNPEFIKIGRIFLEKQKQLFGAYHYYAADPFHEGEPPEDGTEYLRNVGKTMSKMTEEFDKDGIWVMQSWSIRRDIACAVPKEKLLILDLAGGGEEKHNGFWGYPFLTGNLHNFGGRTALHGDLNKLAENAYSKAKKTYPNVCGTGLFMEGINQNPVYYDLAFMMLTEENAVDLNDWLKGYIKRRYAGEDERYLKAWQILRNTVYAPGTNGVEKSSVICARPAVDVKKSGPNDGFHIPYGNRRLAEAFELLYSAGGESDGYKYDIVDILRQVLSNYAQKLYAKVSEAFKNREAGKFAAYSGRFLNLLDDMDCLLELRPEFSLKKWLTDARRLGETEVEKCSMEYCAGVLLTIWGPEDKPKIFDYAWREWSGLIGGFYKRRWEIFFDYLNGILESGKEYYEDILPLIHGRESFRANECYDKITDFEINWLHEKKSFSDRELDFNATVRELWNKYKESI